MPEPELNQVKTNALIDAVLSGSGAQFGTAEEIPTFYDMMI